MPIESSTVSQALAMPASMTVSSAGVPLVAARHLSVRFSGGGPWRRVPFTALSDVTLDVGRGETVGVVGESGSGKTTLGRALLHLVRPASGQVLFDGTPLSALSAPDLRRLRRRMQMVFQEAHASLDPRQRVRQILAEPLLIHGLVRDPAQRAARVVELLREVGLGADALDRFPHMFSGGQRQRINIARALATRPDFLVADEPVSSLDLTIQRQIVELLMTLKARYALAVLFVSHDLRLVHRIADAVAVMCMGQIVEVAPSGVLLSGGAAHPYTQALIAAMPPAHPRDRRTASTPRAPLGRLDREVGGCVFKPRCPAATSLCGEERPPLKSCGPGHSVACHHA